MAAGRRPVPESRPATAAWMTLPAIRLGQRAAAAFVATSIRRNDCIAQLSPRRRSFYLNEVGLFATHAGDLVTALEYLRLSVDDDRATMDMANLAVSLENLADCLGLLGQPSAARDAAAEAVTSAQVDGNRQQIATRRLASGGRLRWPVIRQKPSGCLPPPIRSRSPVRTVTTWSPWTAPGGRRLARTGREGPAQALTEHNAEYCGESGWNDDLASCDRILSRLALAAGDTAAAGKYLTAAARCFRDGDFLVELAVTLADLASYAQSTGIWTPPTGTRPRRSHRRRARTGAAQPPRDRPGPDPRCPGHRRREPGPGESGPGCRRRRAAAGHPAPAGLA